MRLKNIKFRFPGRKNRDKDDLGNKVSDTVKSKPMAIRIFKYFVVFTVTIMVLLWLMQILFLQAFYQQMKINELYDTASEIESNYGRESFSDLMTDLTVTSDMYIQIDNSNTILYATTSSNPGDRMNAFASRFDTDTLKERLEDTTSDYIVVKQRMYNSGNAEAMIYASVLDETDGIKTYLFIYAPLTPVGSTIHILARILIWITCISIIFGIIMSIIISRRLARPINSLTASAARLADGNYEVNFDGSGTAETEELAATLNYAEAELSKSDKLQKDLIANVSHDLKTPLTMVKSYAEMIRDISGNNPEKRERHLNVIISEADRLNDLVNDLTVLSKMQAKVDDLDIEDVDLKTVAEDMVNSFSLHSEQDNFDMRVETEGEDFTVEGDLKKIKQVFANLIGNAVRYSSDDKYVRVVLKDCGDYVRCEVRDHGQGISAEDIDQIWDRYYQSSKNHSRTTQGTGLGLSIVKQIFILHHARYGVESTQGEGSCFWFELDRKQPRDEANNA